ncbi:MAG: LysR family transcriptional regulator, partial [Myxococcota bacterium]
LTVFRAIVEAGTLTAAARRLGLSKGVVSTHLSSLEASLGVQLLNRTTRSLALTQVGSEVFEATLRLERAAQEVAEVVTAETETVRGLLRVASPVGITDAMLRPVIGELHDQYPDLRIELHLEDRPVDLISEGIDVALRVGVPEDSTHVMTVLGADQEIVLGAPVLAARWGVDTTPAELAEADWITHVVVEATSHPYVHESGRSLNFRPNRPQLAVSNTTIMRSLAVDGLGVCTMPRSFALGELQAGRLVRLARRWRRRSLRIYALRPSRASSRRVAVFLDAIRKRVEENGSVSSASGMAKA